MLIARVKFETIFSLHFPGYNFFSGSLFFWWVIFKKFSGCETRNWRNMLLLSSYMQRFLLHSLCNYSLCLHSASNSSFYIFRNTIRSFSRRFIINFIRYFRSNLLLYPSPLFYEKFFAQPKNTVFWYVSENVYEEWYFLPIRNQNDTCVSILSC